MIGDPERNLLFEALFIYLVEDDGPWSNKMLHYVLYASLSRRSPYLIHLLLREKPVFLPLLSPFVLPIDFFSLFSSLNSYTPEHQNSRASNLTRCAGHSLHAICPSIYGIYSCVYTQQFSKQSSNEISIDQLLLSIMIYGVKPIHNGCHII